MVDTKVYAALIAAQRSMGPVYKDSRANYGRYASLAAVIETIGPPLAAAGLAWFQATDVLDGEMVVVTTLAHGETGETIVGRYPVRCKDPHDPQKVGGAVTYARRYALLALLGLAPEDDDGQHAAQPAPNRRSQGEPEREPTQAPRRNALPDGVGNGAAESVNPPRRLSPHDFWPWARERGFRDRAQIETVLPEVAKLGDDFGAIREAVAAFLAEQETTG